MLIEGGSIRDTQSSQLKGGDTLLVPSLRFTIRDTYNNASIIDAIRLLLQKY